MPIGTCVDGSSDTTKESGVGSSSHPSGCGPARSRVVFGTDFPHIEGTCPHTQTVLHELLDDADPAVSHRIRIGAFRELFPSVGPPPEA